MIVFIWEYDTNSEKKHLYYNTENNKYTRACHLAYQHSKRCSFIIVCAVTWFTQHHVRLKSIKSPVVWKQVSWGNVSRRQLLT